MVKETITYFDYDGNERTEDFYFNLTKAECMEMELGTTGGLEKLINKIVAERDHKKIVELFKDLILRSYGEKSADGKHFYKSKEISAGFASTEAYSELFVKLASDSDASANFIKGIIPEVPENLQQKNEFAKNVIPE